MVLLLISVTGFWPIAGLFLLGAVIGFALGAGVYRNNAAKINAKLELANEELADIKSRFGGTAVKKA